jgi:uncharacterized protein (DUF433 family)
MDWSGCEEVEQVPGKVSGQPILKGTRVPADFVVENYGEGYAPAEVAWMFRLDSVQVQIVIDYAEQMGMVAKDRASKALARSEAIDWADCPEVERIPGKVG